MCLRAGSRAPAAGRLRAGVQATPRRARAAGRRAARRRWRSSTARSRLPTRAPRSRRRTRRARSVATTLAVDAARRRRPARSRRSRGSCPSGRRSSRPLLRARSVESAASSSASAGSSRANTGTQSPTSACGSYPAGAATGSADSRKASTRSTSSAVLVWLRMQRRSAGRPCTRVEEMKPTPLCSSAATRPSVSHSSSSSAASAAGSRRRRATPVRPARAARSPRSAPGRARRGRGSGRSPRETRRAPNVRSESHSLNARVVRVSCRPRSAKFTSRCVAVRVAEVVGADLERVPQRSPVAHEQAAALVGLVQPLVRVERDRVGERDTGERGPPTLGQDREAAVRGVDVEPDPALPAERRELFERIDRTRARRARVRDGEERPPPAGLVGGDRGRERRRLEPQVLADGQDPHLVGPEAERPCSPCERRVRLVGDVDDEVVAHRADERLARAGERGQVRGRAAGHERAGRLGRIADPVLEPAEDLQLELRRAGGLHPRARVDVARARDEVAERARPGAGGRHEREVAGMGGAAREREDVPEEPLEEPSSNGSPAAVGGCASLRGDLLGRRPCAEAAASSSPSQSTRASTVR